MIWFAVPDDLVGGWAVADRQAPRSELQTRPCLDIDCRDCASHAADWVPDVVICVSAAGTR